MRSATTFIAGALLASCAVAAPAAQPQAANDAPGAVPSITCNTRFPRVAEEKAYNALTELFNGEKPAGETITAPVGGSSKALRGLDTLAAVGNTKVNDEMTGETGENQIVGRQIPKEQPDFVIAGKTCELIARYGSADIWICNDKSDVQKIRHLDAWVYSEFALDCREGSEDKGWEAYSAQVFHPNKWNLIIRKNSI